MKNDKPTESLATRNARKALVAARKALWAKQKTCGDYSKIAPLVAAYNAAIEAYEMAD